MINTLKSLLSERYGDRWLNDYLNQCGMAADLDIHSSCVIAALRRFGLAQRAIELTAENEIIARYEVIKPLSSLYELDGLFYAWWGHRAAEEFTCIQREIADDEVIYHFITGSRSHGHSGSLILTGQEVCRLIQGYWDQRIGRKPPALLAAESGACWEEGSP